MNDSQLYEELKSGPRAANYAEMIAAGNDTGIAEALSVPTVDLPAGVPVPVDRAVLHLMAATAGWLPRVRRIAEGRMDISALGDANTVMGVQIAAEAVMDILQAGGDIPMLDLRKPTVQQTLGILHAAAVATGVDDAALAEINALIPAKCSPAEAVDGNLGATVGAAQVSAVLHDERKAVYDAVQAAIRALADTLLAANPDMSEREALERADQILHGHDWGHS